MPPANGYLDWASQTPLHPAAREALLAAFDAGWADPTRLHREGRQARMLYEAAREAIAGVLSVTPGEVSFTSSGTAAAQLAILGTLQARRRTAGELVTTVIEHSCVLHAADFHERAGGTAVRLPVDPAGRLDPDELPLSTAIALVSVQSANQEIGTVQDIAAVADRCTAAGVPLHVDAAMSLGHARVNVQEWGADLLTASAHKFGGPSGVGLLIIRDRTRWQRPGPEGERGDPRVGGPLNVPGAVATAAALVAATDELKTLAPRWQAQSERIRTTVATIADSEVHGDPDPAGRLPHLVNASFLYVDGEALLDRLERAGIAAASGSACTASTLSPSHVLEAIGALTHGNVRLSIGRDTTEADIDQLLAALPRAVTELRAEAGVEGL